MSTEISLWTWELFLSTIDYESSKERQNVQDTGDNPTEGELLGPPLPGRVKREGERDSV